MKAEDGRNSFPVKLYCSKQLFSPVSCEDNRETLLVSPGKKSFRSPDIFIMNFLSG